MTDLTTSTRRSSEGRQHGGVQNRKDIMKYDAKDDEPDGLYSPHPSPGYESRASRRAMAKAKTRAETALRIAELEAEIARLLHPDGCEFCSGLPYSAANLKYDCGSKYGLTILGDTATCPVCDRVMADWE